MKAFIFDMDGVLIDTNTYFMGAIELLFANHGLDPHSFKRDLAAYTGKKNNEIAQILIDTYHLDASAQQVEDEMEEGYQKVLAGIEIEPFDNVLELLEEIKRCGFKTALATGSYRGWTNQVLTALNLTNYFDAIVTGEEVVHGKPHPEIYQKAADKIGVDPRECIVVEDSPNGIRAAQAIGMYTIGYKGQPDWQDTSMASLEVKDFAEVIPNSFM